MLLSEHFASLITVFQEEFKKKYLNSQRMSDIFYHKNESSELNKKTRFQNILI